MGVLPCRFDSKDYIKRIASNLIDINGNIVSNQDGSRKKPEAVGLS